MSNYLHPIPACTNTLPLDDCEAMARAGSCDHVVDTCFLSCNLCDLDSLCQDATSASAVPGVNTTAVNCEELKQEGGCVIGNTTTSVAYTTCKETCGAIWCHSDATPITAGTDPSK